MFFNREYHIEKFGLDPHLVFKVFATAGELSIYNVVRLAMTKNEHFI